MLLPGGLGAPSASFLHPSSPASLTSVQSQSCPTLCDPMNRSTPGLPVHHQLPEFTQTHVHRVGDAIQPSRSVVPFSSRLQSFPASGSFQMSQLFTLGSQSIGASASASVLPMNTQDCSPLGWTGWTSLRRGNSHEHHWQLLKGKLSPFSLSSVSFICRASDGGDQLRGQGPGGPA